MAALSLGVGNSRGPPRTRPEVCNTNGKARHVSSVCWRMPTTVFEPQSASHSESQRRVCNHVPRYRDRHKPRSPAAQRLTDGHSYHCPDEPKTKYTAPLQANTSKALCSLRMLYKAGKDSLSSGQQPETPFPSMRRPARWRLAGGCPQTPHGSFPPVFFFLSLISNHA